MNEVKVINIPKCPTCNFYGGIYMIQQKDGSFKCPDCGSWYSLEFLVMNGDAIIV